MIHYTLSDPEKAILRLIKRHPGSTVDEIVDMTGYHYGKVVGPSLRSLANKKLVVGYRINAITKTKYTTEDQSWTGEAHSSRYLYYPHGTIISKKKIHNDKQ